MREMGRVGGKARVEGMSKKALSESGRKAAKARWKGHKKPTSR